MIWAAPARSLSGCTRAVPSIGTAIGQQPVIAVVVVQLNTAVLQQPAKAVRNPTTKQPYRAWLVHHHG